MTPWLTDLFLRSQPDERLVELARNGQERAFAAIVERYRRQLAAFARRRGAGDRAEDIVQQAFLSAFAALRAGVEVRHLRGWLHQIVRNAAIAAANPGSGVADVAPVAATAELEETVQLRMTVSDALSEIARLPSRQRAALIETAIHGRSRAEVASSMGLSEGAVRQLVHRARAALRTAAGAITPYPFIRWLVTRSAGGAAERVPEITMGAGGAASAGGLGVKLGALVASGVLVTGFIPAPRHRHAGHRPGGRAASSALVQHAAGHAGTNAAAARVGVASVASVWPAGGSGAAALAKARHQGAHEGSNVGVLQGRVSESGHEGSSGESAGGNVGVPHLEGGGSGEHSSGTSGGDGTSGGGDHPATTQSSSDGHSGSDGGSLTSDGSGSGDSSGGSTSGGSGPTHTDGGGSDGGSSGETRSSGS